MGYILPITNHQYKNYRNRNVRNKQDRIPIEPTFRLALEQTLRDTYHREEDRQLYLDNRAYLEEQKRKSPNRPSIYTTYTTHVVKNNKLYASLTGIGRHFNESV
ncbi:hypothetical protein [Pontibacillus litoralis]|uniref:Uncharacterized protein n=1 Tax=Pontibacillus litoralis JSM 072002 TaxID=1385512 RepID=A0A0A5G6W5_9BACI|nr:hypothetical protein [Pontibacillus litoralis]KGX87804.1 hypothetical protein N784_13865 [Pontibacillus litoralis JSM 072002]